MLYLSLCSIWKFNFIVVFSIEPVLSYILSAVSSHMLRTSAISPFGQCFAIEMHYKWLADVNLSSFKRAVRACAELSVYVGPRQPEVVAAYEVRVDEAHVVLRHVLKVH